MLVLLLSAWRRFRHWRNYRRNLISLSRLDERTLRDIGLSPTELPYQAWRHRDF